MNIEPKPCTLEEALLENQELRKKIEELKKLALIDPLTNLGNRRMGAAELAKFFPAEVVKKNRRNYGQRKTSVIMFDIDYFKKINDGHGHDAGDVVLQEVSKVVLRVVRSGDTVLRWGGEEFLVVMPGVDLKVARARAEKIRMAIRNHKKFIDSIQVTVSLGVVSAREMTCSVVDLLGLADEVMYRAKEAGRDRVCCKQIGLPE